MQGTNHQEEDDVNTPTRDRLNGTSNNSSMHPLTQLVKDHSNQETILGSFDELLDGLPLGAYELTDLLADKVERSAVWLKPEYMLPPSLFTNATTCLTHLKDTTAPHLILGDASKLNLLQRDKTLRVIDYIPVVGDVDYDLAYYIYKLRIGNDKIIPAWQALESKMPFDRMQKLVAWMTVIAADNMVSTLHHKRTTIEHIQGELVVLQALQRLSGLTHKLNLK
jgi:hypothetical protein